MAPFTLHPKGRQLYLTFDRYKCLLQEFATYYEPKHERSFHCINKGGSYYYNVEAASCENVPSKWSHLYDESTVVKKTC